PTAQNVRTYADVVIQRAALRSIHAAVRDSTDADELLSDIDEPLQRLREAMRADRTPWSPTVISYGAEFDPAAIPLRQWLLGTRRSLGEVTVDSGPPGTNKSMLMQTDAVSIVTGRRILNDAAHMQGEVLFLVGEDMRRDFEARLAAILTRHHIGG